MYFLEPQLEGIFNSTRVIIFDMNGLIIDDEKIKLKGFNAVLKKYGIQITSYYWINKCVGHKEATIFNKIFSDKKILIKPKEISKLIEEQNKIYQQLIKPWVKKLVRPGVLEIIKYIKEKTNKHLALATSTTKKSYRLILGSLHILDKFDFTVCGEEVKISKPNPEIYLKVKKHFNIKANKCLVFEDSAPGVIAAKNAKMKCFAIPSQYTFNQDFAMADFVISDLSKKANLIS